MKKMFFAVFTTFVCLAVLAVELTDPGFTRFENGVLGAWKNTNKSPVAVQDGVLTVTAVNAKLFDSIFQGRRVTPSDAAYVFSVDVEAPVARAAFIQIKMFAKGKEVLRKDSRTAPVGKVRLYISASHPEADIIEVAMRIRTTGAGKKFKFSNPTLYVAEDGALFGSWLKGGKGFTVTDVSDKSFTVNIKEVSQLHTSMGFIRQVASGEKFVFEADYKSDVPKMAYLEVKYYCKGKELKRKQAYSDATEGKLSLEVNTDGCDKVLLQCRVPASARFVGKKAIFSNFKFKKVK